MVERGSEIPVIVAREAELEAAIGFVDTVADGPADLTIEGEAGIGKTTLWTAAVAHAREQSYVVLSARPTEAEARLSYVVLGDLLDLVAEEAADALPAPQRNALDIVLLRARGSGTSVDQRTISIAVLGVLRSVVRAAPALVAIDDVQWVDPSSRRILGFAARRLRDERLGFLTTVRPEAAADDPLGLERAIGPERSGRITLRPLSLGALDRLLRIRLQKPLPRRVLVEVHRTCGGNPFFALEIAALLPMERGRVAPGHPLPIPPDVGQLLRRRLARLPHAAREMLLLASVLRKPTFDMLERALGRPASTGLDPALEAEVIETEADGSFRFAHPLLAAAIYQAASPGRRRQTHGTLAEIIDDPEERAGHLALASEGPDEKVATYVADAARAAQARGAPDAAAELFEQALALTPASDTQAFVDRTIEAADAFVMTGDRAAARALIEEALPRAAAGPIRAQLLWRLADTEFTRESAAGVLRRALQEAAGDMHLSAYIHRDLAIECAVIGPPEDAVAHARAALEVAERIGDRGLIAATLTFSAEMTFRRGGGLRTDLLERAVLLEEQEARQPQLGIYRGASGRYGRLLAWAGDLDAGRARLQAAYRRASEWGDELEMTMLSTGLAELECRAGNLKLAAEYAEEAYQRFLEGGHHRTAYYLYPKALVDGTMGRVEEARALAEYAVPIAEDRTDPLALARCQGVLGLIELSLGDHPAARLHLEQAHALAEMQGVVEPAIFGYFPDLIEALIGTGELERAAHLLTELRARARTSGRRWALASAARCHALLLAKAGKLQGALSAADRAVAECRSLEMPIELGRALLAMGQVKRRAKLWRQARESLEQAVDVFEAMGASKWARLAQREAARIGGRPPAPLALTETERKVAELIASGLTTREVASRLFLSEKAVEANIFEGLPQAGNPVSSRTGSHDGAGSRRAVTYRSRRSIVIGEAGRAGGGS